MENPTPTPLSEGRFVPEVEEALRAAGWFPGRVAPKVQLEKWLVIDRTPNGNPFQIRMFSAAWRIMREFGGLTIATLPVRQGYHETITFDPLWVGQSWWNEIFWMAEWEGVPVYPLGITKEEIIAVTGQGQIINDDDHVRGNTIEEALTNILMGQLVPLPLREIDPVREQEASYWLEPMRKRFDQR